MDEKHFSLLLLPGMDGTGELFAEFVKLLPNWIEPHVVSYPRDNRLSYDQLLPILESVSLPEGPFVILAESFSTPLAVRFAAKHPKGLEALVLCAGFVSPPRCGVLSHLALILARVLFIFGLPRAACREFLIGDSAGANQVDALRSAVASVSSEVLTHRLKSVLSCNIVRELQGVSVPLLYISGAEDRLVGRGSFQEILQMKPGTLLASIPGPHLILQARPREAVDTVVTFLQKLRNIVDPETAESAT